MRERLKVHSSQFTVGKAYLLLVFFVFTFHFLPSTSFAGQLPSRAAVVMEASTGRILYAKNQDLRCPPASTTKLMTAIVVMDNADMDYIAAISRNASGISPHKAGFKRGDRVKIEELLSAALINSANDAAVALAEAVAGSQERFVELMNRKAVAIGATNTHFVNASGLPGKNQYTTASDLAKIMRHALRYPKLKEIIGTRVTEISTEKGKTIFLRNTNRLLWSEEDLVGGKTGYTRKAKHCFVCAAEREDDTIIVALLGSPSRDSLWRESETLIAKGYDVIENRGKPEIYLATAVYDAPAAVKAVSKTTKNGKIKKSYAKTGKKKIAKHKGKKKRTMIAAKKKGKTKVALSKGKQRKYHTKKKAKKNYRIAIKGGVDKG